jgi:hypothetical protein
MRQNPINLVLYFFLEIAVAAIVSSCGKPAAATPTLAPPPTSTPKIQPTDTPLPTVTPVCISSEPTQADIDRALAYTGDIFSAPNWEQSYTVNETAVAVLWQDAPQSALVYLEALIFPCSYEEPDLNIYFSAENWNAVFANYESYELIDECKSDGGLRLYEFKTQNQGFEYEIRYWVENDTDTRVIATMIVFPLETKLLLDEYSSMLFPGYSTCP